VHQTSPTGTLLASYFYDYQGRRSRKVTTASAPQGAATILYFYDRQNHLIAEMTPQGNPLITYVWRDDVPVSLIVHGTPEAAVYLETDHLNTPITARNQAGTVVWKWESDAFGSTLPNEDPDNTGKKTTINLRFPGQYFDKESGLHYNWNRYYDPKIGRYMSSDPIGLEGGINTYGYANGNPVSVSDPNGEYGLAAGLVVAGGFYVGMNYLNKWYATYSSLQNLAAAQQTLSAATSACVNYPSGGACSNLSSLQNQVQQCTAGAVNNSAAATYTAMPAKPWPSLGPVLQSIKNWVGSL